VKNSPQIGVAGVTGYAGAELARLLLHHPGLKGAGLHFFGREAAGSGSSAEGARLIDLHPQLANNNGAGDFRVEPLDWGAIEKAGIEILFLATPHEQSRNWAPEAAKRGIRIVDLSGAWRLQEAANRAVYKFEDEGSDVAVETQLQAIYGLPELHRDAIADAKLVANPGCYATSIILGLAPLTEAGLADVDHGIVCDSKSGVSGAGKAPTSKTHFMYAADNLSAYAVFEHRHTGELLEQLHLQPEQLIFTPHLLPIPRGILSTIYVTLSKPTTAHEIEALYREFYAESPMVRIYEAGRLPQIQYSVHTNYCDIGFALAADGKRLIVVSCLDNLLKGAAGQAVQNMNLMLGWPEQEGLA
jgi:N-acetyl-gamma-glutamyl-phosphate reductase